MKLKIGLFLLASAQILHTAENKPLNLTALANFTNKTFEEHPKQILPEKKKQVVKEKQAEL